jgi:periplasmic protein TonB
VARRKKKLSPVYVISLGAHLLVGAALALVPQKKLREVVAIALNEAPPKEEQKEPPKPPEHRAEPPAHAQSSHHVHSEPVAEATAEASSEPAFHNLGLTLDSSSADGLAVRIAAPEPVAPPPPVVAKPKILGAHKSEGDCTAPLQKARPISLVRPSYTDEARRAHVEGRVRIELAVDEHGDVTDARILDGLGYGLDEAALEAARKLRFEPALRCSHRVAAPFVIAMRFMLGT